ncbi:MAG: STAS domain-containing protein [Gammaproteobacteria bacterium]|nr:STAS domain-containing protein [Gammaproteobacteria bacterium]MBU2059319.1 STAS domain-containing protein [Gammaproteobacteria bacterium]MBU2175301.1 STAS domain-containing protein [Gammaproteobacteria bacterium]MBU2247509.1 STAS domain-containing protein [Gammaproteobacteria bacterium]MBU2342731.1 STAS domain-containing protein [Gammaproteobacteria bacterium]
MTVSISQTADFQVFGFSKDLTIFNVHDCLEQLQPVLEKKPEKVLLDLSEIEDIDTAGLQLVWWLVLQLQQQGMAKVTGADNGVVQRLLDIYQFEFPDNLE